jgi:hypothetical protein
MTWVLHTGNWILFVQGVSKQIPWVPGSKQEIALVNLDPRSVTGTFFVHAAFPDQWQSLSSGNKKVDLLEFYFNVYCSF